MVGHIAARAVVGWIVCVLLSLVLYFSLIFVQLRYGELGQFYADSQVMDEVQLRDKYGDLWATLESGWMLDDWVFLPLTAFSVGITAGLFGVRRPGLLAALGFLPLAMFLMVAGVDLRVVIFISVYFAIAIAAGEGMAWTGMRIRLRRKATSSDAEA